jgi:outer membrane biosynthesis protein TonB
MTTYIISTMQLPWSFADDDARFKKILLGALVIFLAFAVPITITKLPELTRKEKAELPPQLARVMLEKQELPPPKPIEPPKEEKKPEEKKPVEKLPEKKPVTVNANKPVENAKNINSKSDAVANAKAQAQAQISTFKDDLMEMREALQTSAVETAAATVSNGAGQATKVDRSMINSGQTKGSGGINVGAYASHDVGGVALSGRETTKVKSGLAEAGKKAAGATGSGGGNSDGAGGAARSEEEMRKVMEQYKSSIFSIYNRALRDNAALQGKVKFKMIIDPSGQVVEASIEFSELKDVALEAKLLSKMKSISFPAANVVRTTFYQTLDFLPQ